MTTKAERVQHANQLIAVIAAHGRRFFFDTASGRTGQIICDPRGRVWYRDARTSKDIYTHSTGFTPRWRGFSHGGNLRGLVEMIRDYVTKGERIDAYYLGMERSNPANGNIWGYPDDAIAAVRAAAAALPIIDWN